jgi:hypothetical protein
MLSMTLCFGGHGKGGLGPEPGKTISQLHIQPPVRLHTTPGGGVVLEEWIDAMKLRTSGLMTCRLRQTRTGHSLSSSVIGLRDCSLTGAGSAAGIAPSAAAPDCAATFQSAVPAQSFCLRVSASRVSVRCLPLRRFPVGNSLSRCSTGRTTPIFAWV